MFFAHVWKRTSRPGFIRRPRPPDSASESVCRFIPEDLILDGHLRILALKDLNVDGVVCLLSTDDEAFTYNKRVNRLATVQEHKMILKAIETGCALRR